MVSSHDAQVGGSVTRRVVRGWDRAQLVAAREHAGLTQSHLARAARVGRATIHQWESGATNPSIDLLVRVAGALDIPLDRLVVVPEDERFPGDWRVLRGLTQPELGKRAGLATSTVGAIERGEAELTPRALRLIAEALDITPEQLTAAHRRARERPTGTPV